ncbi:MAG: MBL fold metallo-hydrolase [Myxococcales bacterium]|nr:MBL fold metallo-hydrolase [Myxococcales bacterium]
MAEIVPCTELHPIPDGEVRLLGAVRTVTGAMTRVDVPGARILVDCGIPQGADARGFRLPDAASEAHALVLTHGHLDHIGSIPTLLDRGFDGPIYATAPTLEITALSLEDGLGLQGAPPGEIERVLGRFRALAKPVPYDRAFDVRGTTVAFREAGHLLGSASVELRRGRARVVLSGDLGRPDSPILRDPNTEWARDVGPVDLLVMESTYGSREHAHDHARISRDLEAILRTAAQRGGHVLVPAFAVGRTQVLLWFIDDLVESGRVPRIPVAIDTPMGLAVTDTYQRFRKLYDKESLAKLARGDDPLDFTELFAVHRGKDSRRLLDHDGALVVIAGSGMCTGGRIVNHLIEGLPDPRTTVLFVGHQAEGTPGARILAAKGRGGRVQVGDREVEVRAEIAVLKGLSAHADRKELTAWMNHLPGLARVALHHGDEEAQRSFAAYAG